MKKTYALLNLLVIIAVIIWNYFANTLNINGNTVGGLSDAYYNLFTPAGYAFSIWGLIFLGLLVLGGYMVYRAFREAENDFILAIGPWLLLANIGNAAWLWFWLNEQTLISVLVMLVILWALTMIIIRLNMKIGEPVQGIKLLVWIPISLYAGWITVATVANISAYLAKIGWNGAPLNEETWALIMIVVATGINLWMIFQRNLWEFALVGVWALVAISVRHWGVIPVLQWGALLGGIVIIAGVIIRGLRSD